MARYYQRPENALKKCNEFIEVGKPSRALDTLYDVIKGKKHRAFSEKVIEPIMLKYLELCVELKKPHTAKEGLYQYRLMCQSVNVGLLEKVIRSFIKMAEDRTEGVRDSLKNKVLLEASQQAVVEVDDLDNLSMAEMTLLNVITEEQAQERSDRAALIPWVKFLWESYTQCLDLLRNNARLENLYHDIAQMAFKFCLSYNRKTEFRKLCERLRKHFDDIINRGSTQMNTIDFSSPETQQLNMETRLSQLDSAITMELWQEAYKAIEDIHLLMNQSKKSQTRMMAYYYQKLSLVFWKAGNYLFHAATLLKYYMLCKDMKKNVSHEELQKNASQVVLATLVIPFPVSHPEFERFVESDKTMFEKAQKLSTLLFLPQPPTRASLIRDLNRQSVLSNAIPQLNKLHDVLETEFNPLGLCAEIDKIAKEITAVPENEYLTQYVEPLQDVTLVRLIKQISQVYQSMDYNHLLKMTIFANPAHLEQLLVDAVRYNDVQIQIDHKSNSIKFGSSLNEANREDIVEGPHLQTMPSESVRLQLVNVFDTLDETINYISTSNVSAEEEALRIKISQMYKLTEKQTHKAILMRSKLIADRREELERSAVDKENEEKWKNEQIIKQQQMIEHKRLESEREERERKRAENEKQEINQKRMRDKIAIISRTQIGKKIAQKFEDDETLDVETFMQRQQEEMEKEAKEHLARMKSQEKRNDHLERAKRIEEIAVLEKFIVDKKELEKADWEVHEKERITHVIEDRKLSVNARDRLKRMAEDREMFLSSLLEGRRHVFEAKVSEFEKRLSEERAKRLIERRDQRKNDKRRKYFEEKFEEDRKKREELERIQAEQEKEERDKIQKEIDEKNRKTLEKQLAREREIEERATADKAASNAANPPTGGPNEWRTSDRAPARERPATTQAAAGAPAETKNVWVPRHKLKQIEGEAPPPLPPTSTTRRKEEGGSSEWRDRERPVTTAGGGSSAAYVPKHKRGGDGESVGARDRGGDSSVRRDGDNNTMSRPREDFRGDRDRGGRGERDMDGGGRRGDDRDRGPRKDQPQDSRTKDRGFAAAASGDDNNWRK